MSNPQAIQFEGLRKSWQIRQDSPGPSRSQIAYTKGIGVFNYYSQSERESKTNAQARRRYIVAISGLVVRISSS